MRESFVFYASFYKAIEELDEKKQLKLYKSIMKLALENEENENLSGIEKAIFELIKPQILANNKRYEDGKKGGRPNNKKTSGYENKKTTGFENEKPNENVNENVNENENVLKEKINKKENTTFKIPSLEEVSSYFKSLNYPDSSSSFYDYYSSNGWKVGKNAMKDWKAAIRNWQRNSKNYTRGDTLKQYAEYNPVC